MAIQGEGAGLLEDIKASVISGDAGAAANATETALASGMNAKTIMDDGLVAAMVGDKFERKEYFVAEVLISARAMQSALALLKPHLEAAKVAPLGKIAVGTVAGDLHDIHQPEGAELDQESDAAQAGRRREQDQGAHPEAGTELSDRHPERLFERPYKRPQTAEDNGDHGPVEPADLLDTE
jgi:hypothetical protein